MLKYLCDGHTPALSPATSGRRCGIFTRRYAGCSLRKHRRAGAAEQLSVRATLRCWNSAIRELGYMRPGERKGSEAPSGSRPPVRSARSVGAQGRSARLLPWNLGVDGRWNEQEARVVGGDPVAQWRTAAGRGLHSVAEQGEHGGGRECRQVRRGGKSPRALC
jgi:hypothetical protein